MTLWYSCHTPLLRSQHYHIITLLGIQKTIVCWWYADKNLRVLFKGWTVCLPNLIWWLWIAPFIFTSVCSVLILDSEAPNIWRSQVYVPEKLTFISQVDIYCRSPVSPVWMLQWPMFQMWTNLCLIVTIEYTHTHTHRLLIAKQTLIGGLIAPPCTQPHFLSSRWAQEEVKAVLAPGLRLLTHHLIQLAPLSLGDSNTSKVYISWLHVCGTIAITQ